MLTGDGLGLRLLLEEDLPLLARWWDDPDSSSMFYSLATISDTAMHKWFEGLLGASNRMRFMIQRLDDNAAIGIIGIEHIDYRNQEGEIAGLLIDPQQRRRGWGTKAVGIVTRYAFDDLNLHRLYARIYGSNCAARRVSEKAGMQCEGAMRKAVYNNWVFEDLVYMAILREEWRRG